MWTSRRTENFDFGRVHRQSVPFSLNAAVDRSENNLQQLNERTSAWTQICCFVFGQIKTGDF